MIIINNKFPNCKIILKTEGVSYLNNMIGDQSHERGDLKCLYKSINKPS